MSISNIDVTTLTPTQRHQYIQNPGSGFFDTFKTEYAKYEAAVHSTDQTTSDTAKNTDSSSLTNVMGLTFTEMAAIRGTSTNDQATYADILNRAYSKGCMDDPVSFLKSLSSQEQGVVQRVHCLAAPINPGTMSKEGAYNLLLPDGYQVDLNHDGMQEVGAAKTIGFPPLDAPEKVKHAWLASTRDMDGGDMLTYQLTMHIMLYGISINDNQPAALAPTDQIDSYRKGVDNYLASLEETRYMLPVGQYERDKAFFSEMQRLLK